MAKIPLGRGAYERPYGRMPEVRVINRYFEDNPTNLEDGAALLSRPPTRFLKTVGSGRIRSLFTQEGAFGGALFVVSGTSLYRLNDDLSLQPITGTVAGTGFPQMAATSSYLFICDGSSLQYYAGNGVSATGTLTLTSNAGNNETVTIGSTVYTWKTTLTGAAYEVKIGASASASLDNLIAAINTTGGDTGAGVIYGNGTVIHPSVYAAAGAGDTMVVTAYLPGTAGNSIATTETMANGAWGGATLSGGSTGNATGTLTFTGNAANNETVTLGTQTYTFKTALTPAANEVLIGAASTDSRDNLVAAINAGAGSGTLYGAGTTANTSASAAAGGGAILVATALLSGAAGNSIATTETLGSGSWGGATLSGGADASLKSIPTPDNVGIVSIAVLAQQLLAVVANSQKFYWILPGELVIDPLNFASAEQLPDELISVRVVGDRALMFGETSTEVWYANPNPANASENFVRQQGQAFSRGIVEGSDAVLGNQIFVVGDDGVVYEISGVPQRISNHGVEERIREALRLERAG